MSGQPYKYYTDVEKYRNEYLDSLNLQTNINDMNLQANKTYKETGALPAVSQMKDSRTTSEILADTEKLKIDIIQSLSKISNPQFASDVVQRIMNNPINQDNSLLIFTAQRINDISDKLTKIYAYGIKGDQNDAQQFVNFVISMYNDKNAIASSTKDFLVKYGSSNLGQFSGSRGDAYTSLRNVLIELVNKINIMYTRIYGEANLNNEHPNFRLATQIEAVSKLLFQLRNNITSIIKLIPTNEILVKIDTILNQVATSGFDIYDPWMGGSDERVLIEYKEYINKSLPNTTHISLTVKKLETWYTVYLKYIESLYPTIQSHTPLSDEQWNIYTINESNFIQSITNLTSIIVPSDYYTIDTITNLSERLQTALHNLDTYKEPEEVITPDNLIDDAFADIPIPQQNDNSESKQPERSNQHMIKYLLNNPTNNKDRSFDLKRIVNLLSIPREQKNQYLQQIDFDIGDDSINEDVSIQRYNELKADLSRIFVQEYNIDVFADPYSEVKNDTSSSSPSTYDPFTNLLIGHGIRKRGRPKGSGIQRKYADVVKRSIIDGKGIQEDMRFIKFGKYLINNKKLNDGILAVKRPSGNNILEFPSQRISKNMQNVIKTMVGGGMPKYEQFECLSEPEKAYLHKLSSKANILDKFSIPAPSKSQYEKDIHDFEVMKGEIMSGNDNKDLIKKFKLHIMKLSKMGSLPKHDVSDILETLIQLGY